MRRPQPGDYSLPFVVAGWVLAGVVWGWWTALGVGLLGAAAFMAWARTVRPRTLGATLVPAPGRPVLVYLYSPY